MLEVVFNNSASISLMIAQQYGEGPFPEGRLPGLMFYGNGELTEEEKKQIVADWIAKKQKNWENTMPIGGEKSDIFCFDFVLNIGGIDDGFTDERKHILRRFDCAEAEEVKYRIKEAFARLEVFCQRVNDGEAVRVWFGRESEDMCGMLWLCCEMTNRNLPLDKVNFIKLPDEKLSVREVSDEEWYQYATLQTLMDAKAIRVYAGQWEALQEANAPLRVVVDGCVQSATEDFYDEVILQEIEKMDAQFREPKLIARLLDQAIGIRDPWISHRLDCFLEKELLELVAVDHECSWDRILRKKGK